MLEYFSPLWGECIVQHAEGCNSESQMLLPQAWLRLVIRPLLHSPSPRPTSTPRPVTCAFSGLLAWSQSALPCLSPTAVRKFWSCWPHRCLDWGSQEVRRGWERHGTAREAGQEAREGWGSVPPTMFYWVWNPFGSCFVFLPPATNFSFCFAFNLQYFNKAFFHNYFLHSRFIPILYLSQKSSIYETWLWNIS